MNNLSVYEFDEVLIMQYFYTYNYYNSLKSSDIVKMIKDMELSASKFKQIKGASCIIQNVGNPKKEG